jgi:hypothetical protein
MGSTNDYKYGLCSYIFSCFLSFLSFSLLLTYDPAPLNLFRTAGSKLVYIGSGGAFEKYLPASKLLIVNSYCANLAKNCSRRINYGAFR